MDIMHLIIGSGILAVLYGIITSLSVLSADTGNEKMQEIAKAIQEGAGAYLSRQYSTIAIVGIVILIISYFLLGLEVAIGFLIGSVMSGIAGYIGMLVSVRANVRTTQASSISLASGLGIAFKSGAVTGMLVAGLALLAVSVYYYILTNVWIPENDRVVIDALVALGFGSSLISIFVPGLHLLVSFSVSDPHCPERREVRLRLSLKLLDLHLSTVSFYKFPLHPPHQGLCSCLLISLPHCQH